MAASVHMGRRAVFATLVMVSAAHAAAAHDWPDSGDVEHLRRSTIGDFANVVGERIRAISPAFRIHHRERPFIRPIGLSHRFRSIDGGGNNVLHLQIGQAGSRLMRLVPPAYADGASTLAGQKRLSAREISNIVSTQDDLIPNDQWASDFLWQWGQFIDHDIDLTDGVDPPEPAPIPVPSGDPFFDPQGTGLAAIAFNRSIYDPSTGGDIENPRQQINEITAWIDASNVYGSDEERAEALRTMDGTGRLRTSDGGLLPMNVDALPNAGGDSAELFLAGDVRANENVGLLSMHTLFVREHNRIADVLRSRYGWWSGERLYQEARRYVGALMQVITYEEYLPALLGENALEPYRGYRYEVDASISNVFSSAIYRYGHSAVSPQLLRIGANGQPTRDGPLVLREAFFTPQTIIEQGGIEPILRGLSMQRCESIDPYVINDLRNFLFGPPGSGGFDLVSLNIQRGRDHGLADYNSVRTALGLAPKATFAEISSDPNLVARLRRAYSSVDDIDVWVGALAEDPLPGAMVGELIYTIVKEQFEALRDGDRYWYERSFPRHVVRALRATRLADVIRRNTNIDEELHDDVFYVPR